MAGGGGGLQVQHSKRGKAKKRKKMKRVGFTLDMTPLVDITFLLLTFFMFTTTMAAPQAMEMSLPPEVDVPVEVPRSLLFNIFVRNDNKIFYNIGDDDPQEIVLKDIKNIAIKENMVEEKVNKVITAVKFEEEANYGTIVNILDQLNLAEANIIQDLSKMTDPKTGLPYKRERRFALVPIDDAAKEKVDAIQ